MCIITMETRDPLCSGQRGSFAKAHFGDQRFTHVNMLYTVCETSQICLWGWISYIVSYKFLLSKNIWKQSETRGVRSPWGPIGQKTTPIQTQEEAYRKQPSAHVPPLSSTVPKAEEDSGNANTLVSWGGKRGSFCPSFGFCERKKKKTLLI